MGIFNLKRPKVEKLLNKDHYCYMCHRKLGKYIETKEVQDGTDEIYDICSDCYPKMAVELITKGAKK